MKKLQVLEIAKTLNLQLETLLAADTQIGSLNIQVKNLCLLSEKTTKEQERIHGSKK